MKKIFLFAAAALTMGANNVNAQNTGNVIMNVTVADVVAVVVTTPLIPFVLSGSASYAADQTFSAPAGLTVISTQPYDLAVKSQDASLTSLTTLSTIPVSVWGVQVTSNNGGTNNGAIALSQTDQQLLNEADAGLANLISVDYTLKTQSQFSSFAGVGAGLYTGTMIYTASID